MRLDGFLTTREVVTILIVVTNIINVAIQCMYFVDNDFVNITQSEHVVDQDC